VEFNVPPSNNVEQWIRYNKFMLDYIDQNYAKPNGLLIAIEPSVHITPLLAKNKIAKRFGCSPSYDAYTLEANIVKCDDKLLRTAAGHVQVGYDNPEEAVSIELIKVMDLYLGLPSLFLDNDTRRRKLYGKAGEFRIQQWGCEYRVLSNFWLRSEELMKWVYDSTHMAIASFNEGREVTNPEEIVHCINNYDKVKALDILDDYGIEIPYNLVNEELSEHFYGVEE
jgi:hypothetical protein